MDYDRYHYDYYLWAINQDGTGLTRLSNEPVTTFAMRPTSTVQSRLDIAYFTADYYGYEKQLKLLSWPDGSVKTITSRNYLSESLFQRDGRFLSAAYDNNGLVWSPSGNKLAFVSAMDDIRANVFVYDVATEQVTRISANNDSDDYKLLWSSDERYVIHQGFSWGPMHDDTSYSLWSARADASGVTQLVGTGENRYLGYYDMEYLGWLNPKELMVTFDDRIGGNLRDVRVVNIETGASTTLVSEPALEMAYSPEHNVFLLTKSVAPEPNRLLVLYQNGERREIAGYTIKYVEWLSANDVFLGQTPDGRAYLILPDGAVTEIPAPKWETYDSRFINSHSVIESPDHQWWAWFHSRWTTASAASELWSGPAMAQPSVRLSPSLDRDPWFGLIEASDVIWSPNAQYLSWLSLEGLFVASPPGFEAIKIWSAPPKMFTEPNWRWSLDSQHLLLFTEEQGMLVASAPDFKITPVADMWGAFRSAIWVK